GCDATNFHRDEKLRRAFRRKYDISNDDIVFCYAGKIVPHKGAGLLVSSAIAMFKSGINNVKVLCIGGSDPQYLGSIRKEAYSSGYGSKFIFLPPVPNNELYKYYSMADAGVWPKQCSITMLEAMSCNLPVIISDNAHATEGVAENGSGFIYKEGDVDDLVEKMKCLLDKKTREEIGKNARIFAEKHDWSEISLEFEKIYQGEVDE
ncbi:MAG: hypothetical protein CVT90_01510, partial [Candidatus Altiarchaeales archaeon HGW-Altiarchaeales-3]